jgi:hypothetical protein
MDQINLQKENLAFAEKIALAELEEAKAAERVKELKFHQARFNMDFFIEVQKERDKQMQQQKPVGQP